MAKIAEDFPLACPACGGDIRLIAFITDPAPISKILLHLGEPLEPARGRPARRPNITPAIPFHQRPAERRQAPSSGQ